MPYEVYVDRKFSEASRATINQANAIIAEYKAQGFVLTLRQLYYQFVARGLIQNKQSEYKRIGSIINDGRLAGLIDWEMIEDRTRSLESPPHWTSAEALIAAAAEQFKLDIWAEQEYRPEVWIEKEALVGVIIPVCEEFRVPYFACRGYSSQSAQWRAGHRFRRYRRARKKVLVLHLGDHDPSGLDMTRDNADRLKMFAITEQIEVRRLALNFDQVQEYNPPPNFAKETDSRHSEYSREYGDESWELDALEPSVIDGLIRTQLQDIINQETWDEVVARENRDRTTMTGIVQAWDDVVERYGEVPDDEE